MAEDVEGERLPLHRLAPLGRETQGSPAPQLDDVLPSVPGAARRVRERAARPGSAARGPGLLRQDANLRQQRGTPAGVPRRRESIEEASLTRFSKAPRPTSVLLYRSSVEEKGALLLSARMEEGPSWRAPGVLEAHRRAAPASLSSAVKPSPERWTSGGNIESSILRASLRIARGE